jgi:D-alanine-D-alanine ligase
MIDEATGEVWLNEINTIPGSLSFYLWEHSGVPYADLIDKLVSLALKRQRKEESITYSFATNILSLGKSLSGEKGMKKG